jgi:hypothetical protein
MPDALPKLDDCPFCGGEARFYENAIDFEPVWGVACTECSTVMDSCCETKEEAAEKWNTRV